MNNKKFFYGVVVLMAVLGLGAVYFLIASGENTTEDVAGVEASNQITTQPRSGVALSYTSPFSEQRLTQEDIDNGFLHRLTSQNPPIIFTVRQEAGLQIAANATGQSILDMVASNLRRAYPDRFPGFEIVTEKNFSIDGRDAKDIVFTYNNASGQSVKQRFVIVRKTSDVAIYLSMQSQIATYDDNNTHYFERLLASVKIQS